MDADVHDERLEDMKLNLPLSTAAIRQIDRETFDEVIRLATGGDHWNQTRRDAQRTIHRGLDCGMFGLDRNLKIRLQSDLDEYDNHIGQESSGPTTEGTNPEMNTSQILVIAPTLNDEPDAEVQPSLQDMVREHYTRRFGAAGGQIADNYIERLIEVMATDVQATPAGTEADEAPAAAPAEASAAAPQSEPVPTHRPSPTDHDRTPLRAVVMAIVTHNHGISSGERTSLSQMERYVRMWRTDERLLAIHPVLRLSDDRGGFSINEESPLHIGSIARRLASEGLLDRDSAGYAPKGTLAEEDAAHAAAARAESAPKPEAAASSGPKAAEQPQPPQRDALDGLKDIFRTMGMDVKVGGVDLVKGVERTSRTGNALPLVASLATAVLAAAAASEMNRKD